MTLPSRRNDGSGSASDSGTIAIAGASHPTTGRSAHLPGKAERPFVFGLTPVRECGEGETVPEGYTVVYTPYITLKNGKRLYAATYGLKAFRLKVRKKQ